METYIRYFEAVDELEAFVDAQEHVNGLAFRWDKVGLKAWITVDEETSESLRQAEMYGGGAMKNLVIEMRNPWSGELVTQDVTDLTETELEAFAENMNDDLREELHNELAPCTPGEFLVAWCSRVSREEAGRVILGG